MVGSYRFMSFIPFHWENKEVDDEYIFCWLFHKPHALNKGISGDVIASVTQSYTCPSPWMLDGTLEKYVHLCAMSLAAILVRIPFPDGSYYHLIIFKPWFYFKQFTIVKGHHKVQYCWNQIVWVLGLWLGAFKNGHFWVIDRPYGEIHGKTTNPALKF